MSFKCNIHRPLHGSYDNILNYLNLIPLKTRRLKLLSKFLYKLISGLIDCPDLLYLINFKINSFNTKISELFYPVHSDKNYMLNCPANRFMIAGNSYTFDFNYLSLFLYGLHQLILLYFINLLNSFIIYIHIFLYFSLCI